MSIGSVGLVGFRFVDLFAGIGGFRLALESLGGKCVMSSEIEPKARLTYHANFGEWPSGDIRSIRGEDVPDLDILCGGFPCQCFSIAGGKQGFLDETRGTLFFEIVRIVAAKRPAGVFMENVPHLPKHDGGRTFAVIRQTLEGIGYVVHHGVLNASLYGSVTARKRIFIVAIRGDLGAVGFQFPEPTYEPVKLADVLLPDAATNRWVVRNHPIHIDRDALAAASNEATLGLVQVGRIGDRKPAPQGYRVYDAHHGHAVTFCARGGGIGTKSGLYFVNGRVRRLDPRECLTVMGYPGSFVIPTSVKPDQVRSLTGNTVVVPLVRLVAERILAALSIPMPASPLSKTESAPKEPAPSDTHASP